MAAAAGVPPRRLPLGLSDLLLMLIAGFGCSRLLLPMLAQVLDIRVQAGISNVPAVMFLLAVQTLVLSAVIYAVAVRWRGVSAREMGFVAPPPGSLTRAVLLALVCFPIVGAISWLQQQITGEPFRNPQFQLIAPPDFAWSAYLATLLVAAVLAPTVEEIAFRGILYRWFAERMRWPIAVAGSALVFAFLHGVPSLIPGILVLGAILAWVYERTRSIWVPIVLHGTYNAIVTTVLYAALAQGIRPPGLE